MQIGNLGLLTAEAVLYFCVMTAFLHYRHRLGLGVFLTALGVMHFMETYLAAIFYVSLPFGVASPGSSILFTGKLMMVLLLYMKEDAATVRQPIYGLFLGNLLTVAIAQILYFHQTVELSPGRTVDFSFLNEIGVLMVWGTTLLYIDSIGIILLYEKLGRWFRKRAVLRFAVSGAVLMTFDQVGFYAGLVLLFDAPVSVLVDGWKAKMFAVLLYAGLFAIYQMRGRVRMARTAPRQIADIFNELTFRERYEDLLSRSGHDSLTGLFDRNRMEVEAPKIIAENHLALRPTSVIIIDVDHFKPINDGYGHLRGDETLKQVASVLQAAAAGAGHLFRFGGEEFVMILPSSTHEDALRFATDVRKKVESVIKRPDGDALTVSIGVSTSPDDGPLFDDLLSMADGRLYGAKNGGRNQVHGRMGESQTPPDFIRCGIEHRR